MKLTNSTLQKIVLEVLNEEEPDKKPVPPQPPSDDSGDTSKELKIDIPDSPFNPDTNQIANHISKILKQWKTKEYSSDEIRWKSYHNDIVNFLKKIKGDD